jgi:mRNA interferase YafQ
MKKVAMTDAQYQKFILYLSKLLNQEFLPPEALDHSLLGEWKDTREFHISGDLLVIYRVEKNQLQLIRIGTHSQLFK